MSIISISFERPLLLLLIIPMLALALWPYLRLPLHSRRTKSRVISLVVHAVILCLCVLLMSGINFHRTEHFDKPELILLIDVSDSMANNADRVNGFVKSVFEANGDGHNIHVVVFANGRHYVAESSEKNDMAAFVKYLSLDKDSMPDKSATDISQAINYAQGLLEDKKGGRILLVTDGFETDGNAVTAARVAADAGNRVDVAPIPPARYEKEAQLISVDLPETVIAGDRFTVNVSAQSASSGSALLRLYDNSKLIGEKTVTLAAGVNPPFAFAHTINTKGFHEIRAEILLDGDAIPQNNVWYSYINLETPKVLILDGTGNETNNLPDLLKTEANVDNLNIKDAPTELNYLRAYDEVILLNVANSAMPEGFDGILSAYVRELGGGLLAAGGDQAYRFQDMQATQFNEMLPVYNEPKTQPMALMILLDTSLSMNQYDGGGMNRFGRGGPFGWGSVNQYGAGTAKTKLEYAIEAAEICVKALKESDFVGIITFNATAELLVPLTPVTQKDAIIRKMQDIWWYSGTMYYDAINFASREMKAFNGATVKHIMFITDGLPYDRGYNELIKNLGDITLSTIGIGADMNAREIANMAQLGGGRSYYNISGAELAKVMEAEVSVAERRESANTPFTPVISSYVPAVAGIGELPRLGGRNILNAKDGAEIILAEKGEPVYAEWSYGQGRVGSFLSDLSGKWSSGYFIDEQGSRLLKNIVKSLLPGSSVRRGDIYVELMPGNYSNILNVETVLGKGESLSAATTAPNGDKTAIDLPQAAANFYAALITTETPGVYTININKSDEKDAIISEQSIFRAFSRSAEYDAFKSEAESMGFAQKISESGGGALVYGAADIFERQTQNKVYDYSPRVPLLIAMIILFLFDILVRMLKFGKAPLIN